VLLEAAVSQLRWADDTLAASADARGPHVLLLHAGAVDAHVLDPLLSACEKEGVRWIPLGEGLADPVYAHAPDPPRSWRADLPSQMIRSRHLEGFTFTASPAPLLERLCLDAKGGRQSSGSVTARLQRSPRQIGRASCRERV